MADNPAAIPLSLPQWDCLQQIVRADRSGNPTWDGDVIDPTTARSIQKEGLVVHKDGYWFPTSDGRHLMVAMERVI